MEGLAKLDAGRFKKAVKGRERNEAEWCSGYSKQSAGIRL